MIGKIKKFNFKSLLIFNTFALIATCFFFNNFIFIGVFAIFFFVSLFSTKNGLEIIRKLNLLQNIRTEGPSNHYKKSDTPTMGGVFLIIPFLIFLLIITINLGSLKLFLLLLTIFGFFITGFLDDYLSIRNKENTGLKTEEKFINEMKALIKEHEEWVAQRANASPLMNEMKKNQQAAKKLIIAAEKAHKSMVELVEANEDRHTSFVGWEEKRRKHTSLSGKLTTAKKSSEEAVRFWREALEKGLEALLIDAKRVEDGGQSTLSLRKENKRSEEE